MNNNRFVSIILLLAVVSSSLCYTACKKTVYPTDMKPPVVTICTSNITDGCLDNWTEYSWAYTYINPSGEYLQTLNELAGLPPEAGGPGPVTADTVSDCVQGTYAARLTSKSFSPLGSPIFIPGYLGASVLDIPNFTIHLGRPYNSRPARFQAQYKYAPVNGDSAMIEIMLSRYNAGLGKRDTISFDKVIIKNSVPSYTQFDQLLTYRDTISTPDTLVLIFCSSADIKFNDVANCSGQVGSTMWVDDLKFVFPGK
jgi:hypothetical protein